MGSLYENIMQLCESHGITGYRLCKDIGLTPGALTDLKMGRKQSLSAKNMEKVASHFGVSIDYLMTGNMECKKLHFANGVAVYQHSFQEVLDRELSELDPNEYRVVARSSGAAVVVSADSPAPQNQIDQIVSLYIGGNTASADLPGAIAQKNIPPVLNEKDKRDIAKDLESMMARLDEEDDLMFDGNPMSPEARESILAAMKLGLEAAKVKNKERFTPKKYRR